MEDRNNFETIVFNNGKRWKKKIKSGYKVFDLNLTGGLKYIYNELDKYEPMRKFDYTELVSKKMVFGNIMDDYGDIRPRTLQKLYFGEFKNIKFYEIEYTEENVRCTFMWDNFGNHYVWIGGCARNKNPYLHFINRGYGKDFEKKMLKELYNWLMTDVLTDIGILLTSSAFDCETLEDSQDYIEEQNYFKTIKEFTERVQKTYNYKVK